MASRVIDTEAWQERWAAARAARAAGRTSAAIELSTSVVAAHPHSAEPYFETADFLCELQHNLASLDRLYQKHREAFGLAADDLTWRPSQFPIARNGLSQIASLLRIACAAAPENAARQHSLADALERLGETDESIYRREHIAKIFPNFEENQWALLKLLERTGDYDDACRYGESLMVRAALAPEAVLSQARIHDRRGETQIVQLLCNRLQTHVSAQVVSPAEQIDFLFRLAWAAARDGLPANSGGLLRDLRRACAAIAKGNFSDAKARLADGYAGLIEGDIDRAKASFAIASWIVSRNDEQNVEHAAFDTLSLALQYARAFLLDLAPPLTSRDEAPRVHNSELALAHSYWLRKSGRLIDALTELARWLAAVPDVIMPRMYNGHYIALRNGVYFGVPLSETRFTIIGGRAYRVTPVVLLAAKLLPRRVRALMHGRAPAAASEGQASARSWKSIVGFILTSTRAKHIVLVLVRSLLARQSISNALQAPNLHKLFADIDKRLVTSDRRIDDQSAAE